MVPPLCAARTGTSGNSSATSVCGPANDRAMSFFSAGWNSAGSQRNPSRSPEVKACGGARSMLRQRKRQLRGAEDVVTTAVVVNVVTASLSHLPKGNYLSYYTRNENDLDPVPQLTIKY